MMPCPSGPVSEFTAWAADHPQYDYGVHLTLTSEWSTYRWGPLTPVGTVPTLVYPTGPMQDTLWQSSYEVAVNADPAEAEIEVRAQIDLALASGAPITHIDTHMGSLVSTVELIDVFLEVALDYDLPMIAVREWEDLVGSYPALADRGEQIVQTLDGAGLPILDRLVGIAEASTHEQRLANYLTMLQNLEPGFNQLIIHCGYNDAELNSITSNAWRRDSDRRVFTDPTVIAAIESLGIEVVSWGQFRVMNDGTPDFDFDGDVDAFDLLTWQNGFDSGTAFREGDVDLDGDVDGFDLLIWQNHFGGAPADPVPEPSAVVLMAGAGLGLIGLLRRRRRGA
jgi:predicted glycoside hydrolase/deacetylase ChbG (UPF0249 family)